MNLRTGYVDGVLTPEDFDWGMVRQDRQEFFRISDLWMFPDRWAGLTDAQQTEITTFRQTLRDITDYTTANEAAENFPNAPSWMMDG